MRTTVSIDDDLLARAKSRAAHRGQTLGQFIEESVRQQLSAPARISTAVSLPTDAGGSGLRTGIDPSSNRELYDALDDGGVA